MRIHEHTRVERDRAPRRRGGPATPSRARSAPAGRCSRPAPSRGCVGATRRRVVPVWDYVLVTEPLSAEQRAAIGWANGQGLGDMANRFHYSRLTADERILWGGYDAIYYYASGDRTRAPSSASGASPTSPATSSPPSRSSRGSASATGGEARSTPAALLRLLRDRARRTGRLHGRPHRSRRRRQPLRRRGRARPARRAPRPRPRGCGRSARSRSRSRPSRCAGRRSSSPATGSRRPTGGAAAAGSGCGPWTRSGSASTASRSPRRSAASRAYRAARPSRAGS